MDKTAVKIISYFDDIEELLIGVLFFALPFGWTLSIVPMVLFTITLVVNIFTKPDKPGKDKLLYFAPILGIFIWNTFSLLYSEDKETGLQTLTTQLTLFVITIAFLFNKISSRSIQKALYLFLIGCFSSSVIILGIAAYNSSAIIGDAFIFSPFFKDLNQSLLDTDIVGNHFVGKELSYFIHPAYAGLMLSIAMFIILDHLRSDSEFLQNKVFWLSTFTLFGLCLICFSMNGTIALSIGISIITLGVLSVHRIYYGDMNRAIYTILFLFVALLAINPQMRYIANKHDANSLTERMTISESSMNIISENWLMGVGVGDEKQVMLEEYIKQGETSLAKKKINSHNQFLTTWIQSGLIGVLILIWSFVNLAIRARKKKARILYAFSFCMIVSFLFESMLLRYTGVITFTLFYGLFYFYSEKSTSSAQIEI